MFYNSANTKKISGLIISSIFSICVFAQDYSWVNQSSHLVTSDLMKTTVDANGNQYVFGRTFSMPIDFGNGVIHTGGGGAFIVKYNSSGQAQWVTGITGLTYSTVEVHGIEPEYGMGIDVDNSGNVYVVTSFVGTITINGNNYSTSGGSYNSDIIFGKIDANGTWQWVKNLGTTGWYETGQDVYVDNTNNAVYITGWFENSINFGADTLYSSGWSDGFLAKYDFSGTNLFAVKTPSGSYDDRSFKIGMNGTGEIYVLHHLDDNNIFSSNDFYVSKFSPSGAYLGAIGNYYIPFSSTSSNGTPSHLFTAAFEVDAAGNYYIGSIAYGPVMVGTYYLNVPGINSYVAKINSTGQTQWAKGLGYNNGNVCWIQDISLDASNNLYVIGHYMNTCIIDNDTLQAAYPQFMHQYFAKLDQGGNVLFSEGNNSKGFGYSVHANPTGGANIAGISFVGAYGSHIVSDTCIVTARFDANTVHGTTFNDVNNNMSWDGGEPGLPGAIVEVIPGLQYVISDNNGEYKAAVGTGSYTLSIPSPPPYFSVTTGNQTASFSGLGLSDIGNHFGLHAASSVNDLMVTLTPWTAARPGFDVKYMLTYKNIGSTALSGSVDLTHDSDLSYLSSSITEDAYAANTLTWNFSNLQPNQSQSINVEFNLSTSATSGDSLLMTALINPVAGDTNATDNSFSMYHLVTGSYDPNDKSVEPAGDIYPDFISDDKYLYYTIRFQNTGTDTAFNVWIRDTLSSYLDISTFEIMNTSHNCYPVFIGSGNTIVDFRFDNILLPDSNVNESASHGFVKFRIKPVDNLSIGQSIENTAAIYFDFNEPVITNTTQTTLSTPLASEQVTGRPAAVIYPNPFSDMAVLHYPGSNSYSVEIINTTGQVVRTMPGNPSGKTVITKNQLPAGIYFFKITESGVLMYSGKFVIR